MRGVMTLLVNTPNDESETRIGGLANPLKSLQSEAERIASEYPDWTSMVIVFTNPNRNKREE